MPENMFSPKMKGKSINQLKSIVESKDYTLEAQQAAKWELESRDESEIETPNKIPPPIISGEALYKNFLNSLEKKSLWAWKPKYQESFNAGLSKKELMALAELIFEKLEWKILQLDEVAVMAFRPGVWGRPMERVAICMNPLNEVLIYSENWQNHYFDSGRNYQAVKLMRHVFDETLTNK